MASGIVLHHLENSRSQRILWMLEELGVEYDVIRYERDKRTNLAPATLREVHPLGRAPVLQIDGQTLAESGAIIERLSAEYGNDAVCPALTGNAHTNQAFWMHFAEGSLMPPRVAKVVLLKAKAKSPWLLQGLVAKVVDGIMAAYYDPNLQQSLEYTEQYLKGAEWFSGQQLGGADFQMIFPLETLVATGEAAKYPAITAYVQRVHQRAAYQRGLQRGGPYAYAKAVEESK